MLKIEVTAEDIANGKPENGESCPIALALKRAVPGADYIEVDGDGWWDQGYVRYFAGFPEDAQDFVLRFDRGESVAPFAFECDPEPRIYGQDDE